MSFRIRARLAYRHYTRHPVQLVLGVLGISLGVAIVLGIDLTNASAQRGFEIANQSVPKPVKIRVYDVPDEAV